MSKLKLKKIKKNIRQTNKNKKKYSILLFFMLSFFLSVLLIYLLSTMMTSNLFYKIKLYDKDNSLLEEKNFLNKELPFIFKTYKMNKKNFGRLTPKDRVKEEQIKVYKDKIVLKIKNAEWSKFGNTNSMIPFLDENSNAIQIKPKTEKELKEGDIISYSYTIIDEKRTRKEIIIHRIIKIGYDEKGWYAITKGDNNKKEDPEKVRFSQVKRVLVAIIY